MNFWLSAAAAAAGGLLYASPFFPHSAEWVSQIAAFIGLAALLFSLREETSWKKASLLGFIFGLFAFTPGLSWLYQSLHDFGGLPALLSGAALLLMGAANSIFTALTAAAVSKVRPGPLRAAAAFPAAFVFFDWIRGAALCSFPWISFGYIQTGTPFEGFAPVGGVYASELAASLALGLVFATVLLRGSAKRQCACIAAAAALLVSGQALRAVSWTAPGESLSVHLVQPDLPLAGLSGVEPLSQSERISRAMRLSSPEGRPIADRTLIIWPESVINTSIQRLMPEEASLIRLPAPEKGTSLVLNAFWEPHPREFRNSLFLLTPGSDTQRYDKRHLVPFGEFVPPGFHWFVHALGIPMSDQTPGDRFQKPLYLPLQGITVAPMICYENSFGDELSDFWKDDGKSRMPNVLLVSSNLAWFSPAVQYQHLLFSRMRALETALPLISVNNNGASALISPRGVITYEAGLGPVSKDAVIRTADGGPTPYIRVGNAPAILLCILLFAAVFFRESRSKNKKTPTI